MANLLLLSSLGLFLLFIIFLFFNGAGAFFTFILFCIVTMMYSYTPQAKAENKKREEEAKEKREKQKMMLERNESIASQVAEDVKSNFNTLSQDPTNNHSLDNILNVIGNLDKERLKPMISSLVLPLLQIKPLDERVRSTVFSCAQKAIFRPAFSTQTESKAVYDAALDILQQHPEQISLKKYVLEVGRWRYSISRPDGKVTIYDEQSIQNDILVRSK